MADRGIQNVLDDMEQELLGLCGIGGDRNKQLLMFLSGPGSSGKSEVIKALMGYARAFCENLGVAFTRRTIVVTALMGVAATSINGETVHTAAHLNCTNITLDMIEEWKDARMLIVDEISFTKRSELLKLSLSRFWSWWDEINCYWELNGMHRFEPIGGAILRCIREGLATEDDFDIINTRVISNANVLLMKQHLEATHSCRDKTVPPPKHTIVIRSSQLEWKTKGKGEKKFVNPRAKFDLWEKCVDCDVKIGGSHFVDPFLKLFLGIPLMLVENTDVPNNQANGTLCYLHKVHFREGFHENDVNTVSIDGYQVRCVDA